MQKPIKQMSLDQARATIKQSGKWMDQQTLERVTLDGDYSLEELEALVIVLKNHVPIDEA